MRKKLVSVMLAAALAAGALTACGTPNAGGEAKTDTTAASQAESTEAAKSEETKAEESEAKESAETEAEAAASDEPYKIGIVTPTVTVSEDEFRGAQEMVEKYPDLVVHKTLPENFATDKEGCISVVTSLADDPEMKYIIFDNGMEGIVPAFQTIREKRPDIVTMATCNDDPKLLNEYVDISINTDWNRRGETIATKAHEMGAKTLIHYSFPTHMASESKVIRRDIMKATCEKLGMEFVEITTPDPQTGNGTAPMLQFLQEDIPRQIEKYGPDTNIFGTNCPMYDVILDEAFKLKFIVAEQCCPTPTQAYPTVLNLEITEDDQSVTYYVTDATAWWKEMNQLKEENVRDSLTGLLNRKGFHDGLESLFTCQEQLKHAAMIMLDADGLKLVNDIYGHHIGDDYLKRIASALDERTRGRKLSARLGGDEFILFLYGYSAKIDLEQDIEKLRERRGERFLGESENVPVTLEFSMGYAFYPDDDRDYHVLMHLADQNMYEEKRKRKKWRRA